MRVTSTEKWALGLFFSLIGAAIAWMTSVEVCLQKIKSNQEVLQASNQDIKNEISIIKTSIYEMSGKKVVLWH